MKQISVRRVKGKTNQEWRGLWRMGEVGMSTPKGAAAAWLYSMLPDLPVFKRSLKPGFV